MDGARWPGSVPNEGSLPGMAIDRLVPVLRGATTSPDRLLLAVWNGFGFWAPGGAARLHLRTAGWRWSVKRCWRRLVDGWRRHVPSVVDPLPLLETDGRAYVVFSGGSDAVRSMEAGPWRQSPNLWWPDDRAWCVATEIDFDSTLIGGTHGLIEEIVATSGLEALEITPDARLDSRGDIINDPDGTLTRRYLGIE
jgi:hypothetical protein